MSSSSEIAAPQGIRVRDLVVRYGQNLAVDGLSFDVAPGAVVALLGPNGAGKSSTVRCIVGLQRPESGSIQVLAHDVIGEPEAAKAALGYVPEQGHLYDVLTPRETLLLKGRLHGLPDAETLDRGLHLLDVLGLAERADDPVTGFSKGMRQKVVLATVLLPDPAVLVLDEPLAGLDAETTQLVKELLGILCERGRSILYCSHLLDVVEKVADRILILGRGRLVADGTLAELEQQAARQDHPGLESIFRQVTDAIDPREQAERLLSGRGRPGGSP